jgi:3-isopropylmalate dehydrogenase
VGDAPHVLGVLVGEGIGAEVVAAALVVLDAVANSSGLRLELRRGGEIAAGPARRLTAEATEFCESVFAAGGTLLCGPAGGRSVYDLRQRFDLYCKITPIRPSPALADAAVVSPDRLTGVDMLIVRENVGGLYFGDYGRRDGGRVAYQHVSYDAEQIVRVVEVATRLARARRGRLSVVVKSGGVPEVSALWAECAAAVAADHGVQIEILDIDNASFQLVADPRRFAVVVAPNLFGDILGDVAAVLLGSRGMSYSANFGADRRAVYQTGHGAAHDLAGSGRANPTAQILSLALLLRESFGLAGAARCIERAVEAVLAEGFRTPDIAAAGSRIVGTRELGERIARAASSLAGEQRKIA